MKPSVANPLKHLPHATSPGDERLPGDDSLASCCVRSARAFARFNQMVACGDCKQVLKFFREARPLQNYLKFCQTSQRPVRTGMVGDYFVVGFSF
jgi:hypothetical protein